jgi:hypothetical protein
VVGDCAGAEEDQAGEQRGHDVEAGAGIEAEETDGDRGGVVGEVVVVHDAEAREPRGLRRQGVAHAEIGDEAEVEWPVAHAADVGLVKAQDGGNREGDQEDNGGFPEETPVGLRVEEQPDRTDGGEGEQPAKAGQRDAVLDKIADQGDGECRDDEAKPGRFPRKDPAKKRGAADQVERYEAEEQGGPEINHVEPFSR